MTISLNSLIIENSHVIYLWPARVTSLLNDLFSRFWCELILHNLFSKQAKSCEEILIIGCQGKLSKFNIKFISVYEGRFAPFIYEAKNNHINSP